MHKKKFIEFNITEKCNFSCSYCSQGFLNKKKPETLNNATDVVCDGVIELIKNLGNSYVVQFIGGEPFCHPKFIDTVKRIAELGNYINVITNMSFPVSSFKKLVDVAGDKLIRIHGTIHLAQIKDLDKYLENIIAIKNILNPKTEYRIVSILLNNNFDI